MPKMPPTHQQLLRKHSHAEGMDGRGTAAQRGYGYRWQKARAAFLRQHPLCVECQREGRTTAAVVVDHMIPHRGNTRLFWDERNWQSLCKLHHDRKTAQGG